jgi:hypothetical protein
MSEFTWTLIMIGTYRIVAILAGVLAIYLGYRLFMVGIYEKAGDLKATWGSTHLILKQAAPGTFFAVFGALVITFGIWRGIDIKSRESATTIGSPALNLGATPQPSKSVLPSSAPATSTNNSTPLSDPVSDPTRSRLSEPLVVIPQQILPSDGLATIERSNQ